MAADGGGGADGGASMSRSSQSTPPRERGRAVRRAPGVPVWVFGITGAAALLGVVIVAWVFWSAPPLPEIVADDQITTSDELLPIEGALSFGNLTSEHVDQDVTYGQVPPVGGNHSPVWQNCGVYGEPVKNEYAVHAMEHGAVWLTHRPDLAVEQVNALRNAALGRGFVLVSPFVGLPAPIVASAWGVQLTLERADDPRLAQFIANYEQGPQTLEPGASCSGGFGDPLDR